MHQHRGSVALFIAQLAVGSGGLRKNSIAVLLSSARPAQADNQIFDQLGKMSRTVAVAKQNMIEFVTLLGSRQPIFDNTGQYSVAV